MELLVASDHSSWLLADFFFHDRGSLAQKSFTAMLKEILRQILHEYKRLWPVVKPIYGKLSVAQRSKTPVWDAEMLQQALLDIAQQRLFDTRVCIFLDALDEHAGDNEQLASLLFRLSSSTQHSKTKLKICVASRSWTVFTNHFGTCPGLAIHDFTRDDIKLYTTDILSQAFKGSTKQAGQSRKSAKAKILAEQVTDRARGVFIWVRLVVQALAKGIRDGTPLAELEHQLSKMPQELKELYINTLRRIEPEYQDEMHIMLQIALCSFSPLRLETFLNCAFYSKRNEELKDCGTEDEMLRYLTSRSGGLLEAVPSYKVSEPTGYNASLGYHSSGSLNSYLTTTTYIKNVQFIHQTVKDFVRNYGDDLQLQSKASSKGSGHLQLLRYGTRPKGDWDQIQCDVFEHAKFIEDELPQEATLMAFALDRFDASQYRLLAPGIPKLWRNQGDPSHPRAGFFAMIQLLRLAVAANIAIHVRCTIQTYSRMPEEWATIQGSGLLHIAVCGPKIVTGKEDRLAMITLLLELSIPAESTINTLNIVQSKSTDHPKLPHVAIRWTPLALILLREWSIGPDLRTSLVEELLKHGAHPDTRIEFENGGSVRWGLQDCVRFESAEMTRLLLWYGRKPILSPLVGSPVYEAVGRSVYKLVYRAHLKETKLPPAAFALFRRNLELRKVALEHLESLEPTDYVDDIGETPFEISLEQKWGVSLSKLCITGGILGIICTGFGGE